MRLFLDLDTRSFIESTQFQRAVSSLVLKRRDRIPVDVQFLRGGAGVELADGAAGKLGLKADRDFNGPFAASDSGWTKSGTGGTTTYRFDLNLNTIQIDALFAGVPTPSSVALMLEIEWAEGDLRTSSNTLAVTLENDIVRGDEGIPEDGDPAYPPASDVATHAYVGEQFAGKADAQHSHDAADISFVTQSPGTGNEWSPADGNEVATRANDAFHSVNALWSDHNTLFGYHGAHINGSADRHQISHIDGLENALSDLLLKDGGAQTITSPLHLTNDLTIAGKTISGANGIFFDDARPAVKGTGTAVTDGAVAVFDGTSGARLKASSPSAITNLPASPTNAEIATKVNQLLAVLRSIGIIL